MDCNYCKETNSKDGKYKMADKDTLCVGPRTTTLPGMETGFTVPHFTSLRYIALTQREKSEREIAKRSWLLFNIEEDALMY